MTIEGVYAGLSPSELRTAIREFLDAIPNWEIQVGELVTKVGTKYVTICDIHEPQTVSKVPLKDFYIKYVLVR